MSKCYQPAYIHFEIDTPAHSRLGGKHLGVQSKSAESHSCSMYASLVWEPSSFS